MGSQKRDLRIDKLIRANLRHKREKEAAQKIKKLKEVEQLIERKKALLHTNLLVR